LLKKEILELKDAGHTIIFSTHNMSSVEEICDEIALIDHAQVVLSGHVSEVRERFRTNTFKIKLKGNRPPIVCRSVFHTIAKTGTKLIGSIAS